MEVLPGRSELLHRNQVVFGRPQFVLRYIMGGVRFHFALILNRERVLFEALYSFPKGREQTWYEREWDSDRKEYLWEPAQPTAYVRDLTRVKFTRENALYLSTAVNLNDDSLKPVYEAN